jgi:hypothetical protein
VCVHRKVPTEATRLETALKSAGVVPIDATLPTKEARTNDFKFNI